MSDITEKLRELEVFFRDIRVFIERIDLGQVLDDESEVARLAAKNERLRTALEWYGEQARLCRLIHSEGDAGRKALDDDGGRRARTALQDKSDKPPESIETYYARQIEWSRMTFGPALRTKGLLDHITKELREIASNPHDLSKWIDVVILAMDGFWRHGGKPEDLMPALLAKQKKNIARVWPDWRGKSEDSAIEHDRSGEADAALQDKSDE